jgi:hypothetical protein
MICPLTNTELKDCIDCKYCKDGLCDYPYRFGMTLEEIKKIGGK